MHPTIKKQLEQIRTELEAIADRLAFIRDKSDTFGAYTAGEAEYAVRNTVRELDSGLIAADLE